MRLTHFFIDRPRFATVLSVFAGRVARHALPVELRDPAHQGRVGAPAGRRRRAIPGRSRICDAHLARPGQGGGLRSHRQRRALRAARAKSSGLGRLSTPEQFANIIVKSDNRGRVTRVRDIGRVEIGAADYGSTAYMDRSNATALLIYAEPGANSLTVDREVVAAMQELKKDFPPGVDSTIIYDPTI